MHTVPEMVGVEREAAGGIGDAACTGVGVVYETAGGRNRGICIQNTRDMNYAPRSWNGGVERSAAGGIGDAACTGTGVVYETAGGRK